MKTIKEVREYIEKEINRNNEPAKRDLIPHIILEAINHAYENLLKFLLT